MYAFIIFLQLALEALPISSSSHLLLAAASSLPKGLDHFLHGPWGIILALFFYKEWRDRVFWFLPKSLMIKETHKRHADKLHSLAGRVFLYAFISNVITGILYFIIKGALNLESNIFLILGLMTTSLLLLSLKFKSSGGFDVLSVNKSVVLGFVQGLALLPGISRFGSTYVISRWLNLSPRRAFQASFLIEIPTCVAATLKSFVDFANFKDFLSPLVILLGMVASFSLLKFSYWLAIRKKFWIFGVYMVLPIITVFTSYYIR